MTIRVPLRIKGYIQPFERRLGLAELTALSGAAPVQDQLDEGRFTIAAGSADLDLLTENLAYWESLGEGRVTAQVMREATASVIRSTVPTRDLRLNVPFGRSVRIPKRRALRYGPHGIHEYRGKFFPQLVRALLNIGRVHRGDLVADPMIGSGTTAVEGLLAGCRVIGMDMNPLSVFMSKTKCALLDIAPHELAAEHEAISLEVTALRNADSHGFHYLASLPPEDQRYLSAWFTQQDLLSLDAIASLIISRPPGAAQDLMWLSLSNILRKVSLQKTDDLRIRRVEPPEGSTDVYGAFLAELERSVRLLLAFLWQGFGSSPIAYDIRAGDARSAVEAFGQHRGAVDAIITSPPYATALPYLDTDRLSLSFLGLLPRGDVRRRDRLMIGNREISDRQRIGLWEDYLEHRRDLPNSVGKLIDRIEDLNSKAEVGFRRKNLAALLGKYFVDMRDTLLSCLELLRPGGHAFVVVGNNRTTAGTTPVEIGTATLLRDIATELGFDQLEPIEMEMLVPRDIHRLNSLSTEQILVLRRPS